MPSLNDVQLHPGELSTGAAASLPPDLLGGMSRTHGKACHGKGWISTCQGSLFLVAPYLSECNKLIRYPLGRQITRLFRLCLEAENLLQSNSSDLSTKQSKRWSRKDQTLSAGAHKEEAHFEFRGKSWWEEGRMDFEGDGETSYFPQNPTPSPAVQVWLPPNRCVNAWTNLMGRSSQKTRSFPLIFNLVVNY